MTNDAKIGRAVADLIRIIEAIEFPLRGEVETLEKAKQTLKPFLDAWDAHASECVARWREAAIK